MSVVIKHLMKMIWFTTLLISMMMFRDTIRVNHVIGNVNLCGFIKMSDEYKYLRNRLTWEGGNLTSEQIEKVIKIIWDPCGQCKDADSDCQCWNDE